MGRLLLSSSIDIAIAVRVSCFLVMSVAAAAISISTASKCIDGEREVLLTFKHNIRDENGDLCSWGNHNDCCNWDGVGCDNVTGHVIKIDLHGMYLSANVIYTSIPFIDLPYLKYLDLSEISNLLANQSISSLIGNKNNNNGSIMASLQHLSLRQTGIVGMIPENLGSNMPALTHLDLNGNRLEGHIPGGLGNMAPLAYLSIGENLLGGQIPKSFGENMTALTHLDLSDNSLEGSIPETFGNMVKLTSLYLQWNQLEGHIPEALGNMSALEELDLGMNRLEGEIPKSIWNICTLRHLSMESNRLNGTLIILTFCPNHSLEQLYLGSNRITGSFPDLTKFPSLAELSIGGNLLDGVISEHHFVNLSKLYHLDLSSNNFTFNVSSSWLPPFRLKRIALRSCKLGPEFPNWLRTQVNYSWLDISNSEISDSIPSWFFNTTIQFSGINVSHNEIKGNLGNDVQVSSRFGIGSGILDMSFNKLEGVIPPSFFNVGQLYLSRNKFTDLNSLCGSNAAAGLQVLDVSFNHLSGTLLDCWSSLKNLALLNLAHNHNLSGCLPTSIGSLASLMALHLDHNNFTGTLPSSMKNCSQLVALHLGHNNLFGRIPDWIGESLTQLSILVLRSNHFNGSLPTSLCHLQSLQLLDLSMNHISASLPNCLSNLTGMTVIGGSSATIYYVVPDIFYTSNSSMLVDISHSDKIDVVWKGMVSEFGSTLGLVKSIDLSSNMLLGDIPTEITSLVGLVSLNLSRNNLRGQIPSRIGNLASLNTLDLSYNHLSGSIPQSLALIDDIGVLNVSKNNLSGKIPKGTQLQSFDASAYMGNLGLCGDPLPNSCRVEEPTHPSPPGFNEEGAFNGEDMDKLIGSEFYASIGVGYAVGFLGVIGTMLLIKSCRFAIFEVLNGYSN
ncbi:unnamed protein product [Cuscuta epithymum]|uniref:Leucine-rich repeat-containing N-terminal plant-type domain-containing protein n=2 Tax=Cuscuta epithymum TaxID=186058 RepID=A0AAV0EA27_9ASTE|nr:unnamed protein product [Cuscuta epithymum]CAH9129844.1 unnamed protein product [Cuscuta epithymum]